MARLSDARVVVEAARQRIVHFGNSNQRRRATGGDGMKDAVLQELANRWDADAEPPETEDGSEDAKIGNAIAQGERQAKKECADTLRMLVQILGETGRGEG
jgi:hypothetical protein